MATSTRIPSPQKPQRSSKYCVDFDQTTATHGAIGAPTNRFKSNNSNPAETILPTPSYGGRHTPSRITSQRGGIEKRDIEVKPKDSQAIAKSKLEYSATSRHQEARDDKYRLEAEKAPEPPSIDITRSKHRSPDLLYGPGSPPRRNTKPSDQDGRERLVPLASARFVAKPTSLRQTTSSTSDTVAVVNEPRRPSTPASVAAIGTRFPQPKAPAPGSKPTNLRAARLASPSIVRIAPRRSLDHQVALQISSTPKICKAVTRNNERIPRETVQRTPSSRTLTSPRTAPQALQKDYTTTSQLPHPNKPLFTTYQRSFSPAKRHGPISSIASPSPSKLQSPSPTDLPNLRLQVHLLHLSLLSTAATPTLTAYTTSAHISLSTRFSALLTQHAALLPLERATQQHANLLALHRWSAGNTASLTRRLSALTAALAELTALTASGRDDDDDDDEAAAATEKPGPEAGLYTTVVRRFETWMAWVQSVWAARDDAAINEDDDEEEEGTGPRGGAGTGRAQAHFTQIDGLGDGVKADVRALAHTLQGLAQRLAELREAPLPADGGGDEETTSGGGGGDDNTATPTTTPRIVLKLALALLSGMQEEVQGMREVEFEVVAGERAWVEGRVRRIAGEIEGAFGRG